MTTESLSVTIEGEVLTVEIGTVAVAPGGGSGDVVGPASATDDRIAAFDGTTGKLLKQGSVTATAVASHIGSTSNPHSVTAAQAGADPTGTAADAVIAHAGATDPHGDRAFATSAVSTHAALTTGVHGLGGASQLNVGTTAGTVAAGDHAHAGVYQPLATVLTNTTAAFTTAQETKLAGIEALADVTDAGNVGSAIDGATAKTTPVDADAVPLIDSAASNVLKKLSWANLKATVKTYFDTLYQAILVSGTNLKTINSTSLLGSGDIAISASPGGSSGQPQVNIAGAFTGMAGWDYDNTNRSLAVTGATVTANNPILDLSQTWNNAAVAFTAEKTNVTNTASAASSLLHDWQVGGVSKVAITKAGDILTPTYALTELGGGLVLTDRAIATAQKFRGSNLAATTFTIAGGGWAGPFFQASINESSGIAALDASSAEYCSLAVSQLALYGSLTATGSKAVLVLDAANTLAQRNGTAAQTSRIYGTYTDASNYVRASLAATSTTVTLSAETAGTGADNVPLVLTPAGTSQVEIGNGVQFTEMTAPSAPAANKVILYAVDNGAGKTQLMALFSSGAAQQVAIEP